MRCPSCRRDDRGACRRRAEGAAPCAVLLLAAALLQATRLETGMTQ